MQSSVKKKIQFSKLPQHLQQKYVELFRPKELQDILTNQGHAGGRSSPNQPHHAETRRASALSSIRQ